MIPMLHGEGIVMRVLDKEPHDLLAPRRRHGPRHLRALQAPHQVAARHRAGDRPHRLRKNHHALQPRSNEIKDESTKIITTEDPIEYQLDGINQIQVHAKVGLTFAASLRSILRHDPDVILVGEIRDQETAENAIQAALTGHLVFSTLHTNDAAGAFMRLIDMGVEPFLVTSTVEGVMAQRLVRTLCRECRETYQPGAMEPARRFPAWKRCCRTEGICIGPWAAAPAAAPATTAAPEFTSSCMPTTRSASS